MASRRRLRRALTFLAPLLFAAATGSFASAQPAPPTPERSPPAAPPRLSEASPDRLSPLCRTAALRLLQQRRRREALSAAEQQEQDDLRAMHLDCFNAAGASLTSGPAATGEAVLRSVAQVVLRRGRSAAWRLLQEKLLQSAGCDEGPGRRAPRLPASCAALRSLSIQDLASSPAVLLNAVVADVLPLARAGERRPWMRIPLLEEALDEVTARWPQSGASGLGGALAQVLRRRMKEQVQKQDCDLAPGAADKALWVSGMCLIEVQAPANFHRCDADGWASRCGDPAATARVLRLWAIVNRLYSSPGGPEPADQVDLVCTSAGVALDEAAGLTAAQRREAHDYVAAVRALLGGLARRDWVEATSGAVRALRLARGGPEHAAARGGAWPDEDRKTEDLLSLLAALGNHAEALGGDAKGASDAREKILEDLTERMVNRAHRDSGWIVSAGGSLGLFGGARADLATGVQIASPVQLGLGVGLQSYHRGDHGFHAMVTAFDLGQYVTFSGASLEVGPPSVESAVTLGLTVGGWVALRETPLYVGVYGGVSPFVTVNDRPTFELGLATGIYVPLLDFN